MSVERVAGSPWNQWPDVHGIGGRMAVESARGAINGLMDEIIEDHAREHVANPTLSNDERAKGVDELLEAIRRYSK